MRTTNALLLALFASLLPACSGGNAKENVFKALNSGDFAGAIAEFEKAMGTVEQGSSEHIELAVGRCEALAHTDAIAAKDAMIVLVEEHSKSVDADDYGLVVSKMVDAKNFIPAIDLLHDGIENRFEDTSKLRSMIEKIRKMADDTGDAEVANALGTLGYFGE